MQRITRYPLLIRQICSNTQSEEDRAQMETSIRTMEVILDRINEAIRDREGREILATISKDLWIGQGQLDLTAATRSMGPRKLLKEGLLSKAKSKRRLHLFLCSDVLVLTDAAASSLYRMPLPLSGLRVQDIRGAKDGLGFSLTVAYPRGGDVLALKASSTRECQTWKTALERAIKACQEADRIGSTRSR